MKTPWHPRWVPAALPSREAIARLAEEGCVEVFPQRGTQVSRISINRLHHAVFLRTVLEESVLRQLCSTGITPEQFEALEESLRKQRRYYDDQASPICWMKTLACTTCFMNTAGGNTRGTVSPSSTAT